ncbi:TonB-dependent receptor [Sulfidibacter corallicola]|uniref:TonB-dependent receptor n=1 Tax=Sulfidibacter corallicola TaxID=2818388 RepID=A0A8A4TVL4_SULCO|nr:TonB-dependent receptor [Sulfidibacter corallicola]QTD53407.1 TonB-dependent receptor [Sulfidibacter corallicola]
MWTRISQLRQIHFRFLLLGSLSLWTTGVGSYGLGNEGPEKDAGPDPREEAFQAPVSDLSLKDLLSLNVYTVSKNPETIHDTPGVISVITSREVALLGCNNLHDLLEKMPSVFTSGSFFFPQNVVAVRGDLTRHHDNHTLILINGRPLREGYSSGINFPIYLAFPVELIDRVELVRGPGSPLYGTNAYSGIVNIITRSGGAPTWQFHLNTGDDDAATFSTEAGFRVRGADVIAGIRHFDEDGWLFSARDNHDESGSRTMHETNTGVFLKADYRDFTLQSLFLESEQGIMGASADWRHPVPIEDRTIVGRRSFTDLGFKRRIEDAWETSYNLSYNQMTFDHFNYAIHSEDWFFETTQHVTTGVYTKWIFGASFWNQSVDSEARRNPGPIDHFSNNWWNAYLLADINPTESLKLIFGAQYNDADEGGTEWVPRFSAVYNLNERMGFKLLYSKAFRSAFGIETHFRTLIQDQVGNIIGGLRGNPALEAELVAEIDLAYYYYTPAWQFSLTLYRNKQTDLITTRRAADGVLDFVNEEELEARGIELETKIATFDRFYVTGSYTYQTNENRAGIEPFTPVPRTTIKLGLSFEEKLFSATLFHIYRSEAVSLEERFPQAAAVNPPAEKAHLLSGQVVFQLPTGSPYSPDREIESATISIFGTNLLDEELYFPDFVGGRINTLPERGGRMLFGKLTLKF